MGLMELTILAGALAGGFVSGLTGFGTGITALAIWLTAVEPVVAGPLVVVCSLISQLQNLPSIWHAVDLRRVMPFIIGGLVGIPLGTLALPHVSMTGFKLGVGLLLIAFCTITLLRRAAPKVTWGGGWANGVVGLGGGVLGGLAGLSGPLPTIWATLRGWTKDEKRGVYQAYNTTMLALSLVSQAIGGFMTAEVGRLVLVAFPATIAASWLGRRVYDRLGDGRFNQVVLVLLLFSGISLVVTALWS
tara:strand:- start:1396 stop:2133 length:738 start_codon:yes stop_codon:yes gene_type:complete